jgi:hypothetical protein
MPAIQSSPTTRTRTVESPVANNLFYVTIERGRIVETAAA